MKAAVLDRIGAGFAIEDIEIDAPKGREVLVEVKAAGLCHSDLHLAEIDYGIQLPAVLGHELAGIVRQCGPKVTQFMPGDHVVGSLVQSCGCCRPCTTSRTFMCEDQDSTLRPGCDGHRLKWKGRPLTSGFGVSAFAASSLVHENQLAKVPKEIPFPQAALLGCAVITGAGAAINSANMRPGDTVAIIGVGGVGLNVITGARLAGAVRIVAIDTDPSKQELARKFGATDFILASDQNSVRTLKSLTAGGVDHVFEVIGRKDTSEQAMRMARPGGAVYLIGVHKPGSTVDVDVLRDLITKQITLKGVWMGSTNIKHDIPIYANLYLQGRLNLDDLISREINITEINQAYEELKRGGVARTVVTSF